MPSSKLNWLWIALLIARVGAAYSSDRLSGQIEFNRDIRPILSDTCFTCHGPDKANRTTELRFDIEESARADLGGDPQPAADLHVAYRKWGALLPEEYGPWLNWWSSGSTTRPMRIAS